MCYGEEEGAKIGREVGDVGLCDGFFYMGTEMSHDRVFPGEDQQILRGTVQQHENQQHFKVILHGKAYCRIGGDSTLLTNYRKKKKRPDPSLKYFG